MTQNLTISDAAQVVDICEDIVLRFVNHDERQTQILQLMLEVKYNVRWRLVLHSSTALTTLWDSLRVNHGEDGIDLIISMTGEMMFRLWPHLAPPAQNYPDKFVEYLAQTIAWMKGSKEVNREVSQFVAEPQAYAKMLRANPWAMFLYLLSMTDVVNKVRAMTPPKLPPPAGDD